MNKYILILIFILSISSCEKKNNQNEKKLELENNKSNQVVGLIINPIKGKYVYNTKCATCHNSNPKKNGSVGPEIFGSSKELLTKKMILGQYPRNYKPKRPTKIMPLMPHLQEEISNLHAFLNEPT